MKAFLSLLLLCCLLACNSSGDKNTSTNDSLSVTKKDSTSQYIHTVADTTLESRITDTLLTLPFVMKSNKYIDSFSHQKHGIAFMVDSLEAGETEVYVKAGYNGDERFETYYSFYVNPKTLEIKVYDVINDARLTVKEYMKKHK